MKKVLCFIMLSFIFSLSGKAQGKGVQGIPNTQGLQDDPVLNYVEVMPEFPGGESALMKYLSTNIKYPKLAIKNKIEGKVIVEFVVAKDGSIKNVKITKSLGYGCDEEAIRVISAMPKWKPGRQNNKNVNVSYKVPIKFSFK